MATHIADEVVALLAQAQQLKSVAQPGSSGISHAFGETNLFELQLAMERRQRKIAAAVEKFAKNVKIALPGQLSAFTTSGILGQQLCAAFNIVAASSLSRYPAAKNDVLTFLRLVCNKTDLGLDIVDAENYIITHPAFFVEIKTAIEVKILHTDCAEIQDPRLLESFTKFDHVAAVADLKGLVEMYAGAEGIDEHRLVYQATSALEADLTEMARRELACHPPLAVLAQGTGLVTPRACGTAGRIAFFLTPLHREVCARSQGEHAFSSLSGTAGRIAFFLTPLHREVCARSQDPSAFATTHAVTARVMVERWPGLLYPLQTAAELQPAAASLFTLPAAHVFGPPSGAASALTTILVFDRAIPIIGAAFEALLAAAGVPQAQAPAYSVFEVLFDKSFNERREAVTNVGGLLQRHRVQLGALTGLAIRRLPVPRAALVPAVLQILRRQLIVNALFLSCTTGTVTDRGAAGGERVFEIKMESATRLLSAGQHPTAPALLFLQINVGDDLAISVSYIGSDAAPPCPPARLAALLEASHSIPLAWALLYRIAAAAGPGAGDAGTHAVLETAAATETVSQPGKRKRDDDDD